MWRRHWIITGIPLPSVDVELSSWQCSSQISARYFGDWYVAIPVAVGFKHIAVIVRKRAILHANTYVAKKFDFFSFVIYNTLMKQSFVIAVNTMATTQERGEDAPLGLCL
jgi:hypothetical protein